ncbi:MAG: hypothetical protein AM326_09945 [Candidatus Thorarchaeota archaeon SMTZ-45]|nr:MAG: hypothetical protein AM326_09945 [Candidatus Thorarchaeota archaeon SMTZ-45]
MSLDLENMTRSIVENLHQTWLYRAIEGWCRSDALELREELGLASFSITTSDPVEMYQKVKKHLLSKTFHDDETLQFLMDAPRWVGFTLEKDEFQSGQQVIGAARNEAIALLWLMAIPKLIIKPTVFPEDYPIDGIKIFISSLMSSDKTRDLLVHYMSKAMELRGIHDIVFEPNPIGRGYIIDDAIRPQRLRSLLALMIMRSTKHTYDLDKVFTLNEEQIVEEASAYIVSMQAKSMLKNQITGGVMLRPFDWPLIGNPKVCNGLFSTLNVLQQSTSKMVTCTTYTYETAEKQTPWSRSDFISFLIKEITEHYSEIHRIRHGKSKNTELDLFIELLTGENIKIAKRLLRADDPGTALFEELNDYKQKAKSGEKPQITPERRFRIVLSSLKQQVSEDKLEETSSNEVMDQINEAFDAIIGVVESHEKSLGDEAERFAQALCFETAYRILQLLDVGDALMDLPWVSRFVAEESARSDISTGEISNLDDEHRIKRIVSAYAGGLTYLILQNQN